MGQINLFRLFGIQIKLDYSWFFIFFLVGWTLTVFYFPRSFPALSAESHFVMGLTATLLFFGSIVFHEMMHSLVALRNGLPIQSITLFLFGGVSSLREEPQNAGVEFRVAIAGPLGSLLLAVLFSAIWLVGPGLGVPILITGVAQYLGFINLLLAIFNLLPGFPLDGGRVFRSVLWYFTNSLSRATYYASWGGRLLGWSLVGLGVLAVLAGGLINGVWFILIGWFLAQAAEAGYRQVELRQALEGWTVGQIMTPDPVTVTGDVRLSAFVDDYVMRYRHNAFPVVREGRLEGLVSLGDAKKIPREQWSSLRVADVMHRAGPELTVGPRVEVSEVFGRVGGTPGGRVLVVGSDGELLGIVSSSDMAKLIRFENEIGRAA